MLALFGPLCKTAQKMRSGIASAGCGRGDQVQACKDFSFGDWRAGEFAPHQSLGLSAICRTDIARCRKGENFRQLMLQLMLHGAYSIFCLIS